MLARGRIRALALVQKLLPNFWIRRTKDTVKLQLPKKTDRIVLCPLTDLQKKVYKKLVLVSSAGDGTTTLTFFFFLATGCCRSMT